MLRDFAENHINQIWVNCVIESSWKDFALVKSIMTKGCDEKLKCSLALKQPHYLMKTVLQGHLLSRQKDSSVHSPQNIWGDWVCWPRSSQHWWGQHNMGMWRRESVYSIKGNIKCKGFCQLWPWSAGCLTSLSLSLYLCKMRGLLYRCYSYSFRT